MRRGITLLETTIVLALIGIVTTIATTRAAHMLDALRVRSAVTDIVTAFSIARNAAIARATYTRVVIDTAGTVTVASGADTLLHRPVAALHDVRLEVTRSAVVYAPNGLGYGAANTRLIVRNGRAADTIFTSRLGRVRH